MVNFCGFGSLFPFVSPNSCLDFVISVLSPQIPQLEIRERERERKLLSAVRSGCSVAPNSFRQQRPQFYFPFLPIFYFAFSF